MFKYSGNKDGFSVVEVIGIIAAIVIIGLVGLNIYNHHHEISQATTSKQTSPPSSSSNSTQPYWLINDGELENVVAAGLPNAELEFYFNSPKTLLIVTHPKGQITKELSNAKWVQPFTTLASIETAFSKTCSTSIPPPPAIQQPMCIYPQTKYILYDNEGWSLTSPDEQKNAISYATHAQSLVHRHGLTMIFTPATNLSNIIGGNSTNDKYTEFINLNLAGQSAKVADIVDIQAQQAEGTVPNKFLNFAPTVLTQSKQANSKSLTFIGMGTQNCGTNCINGGRAVTGADILADYKAINPNKDGYSPDGYWFNIPGPGTKCVNCGKPDPTSAVNFFNSLYALPNHY